MNKIKIILCIIFCLGFVSNLQASDLDKKINELDKASKSILGVSLMATSELMQLKDRARVVDYMHFKRSGKFKYIEELKNKGYVTYEIVKAIPEGSNKEQTLLVIKHINGKSEYFRYEE